MLGLALTWTGGVLAGAAAVIGWRRNSPDRRLEDLEQAVLEATGVVTCDDPAECEREGCGCLWLTPVEAVGRLRDRWETQRKETMRMASDCSTLAGERDRADRERRETREALDAAVAELDARVADLTKAKQLADARCDRLAQTAAGLQQERDYARRERDGAETTIAEQAAAIRDLRTEVAALQAARDEALNERDVLRLKLGEVARGANVIRGTIAAIDSLTGIPQ